MGMQKQSFEAYRFGLAQLILTGVLGIRHVWMPGMLCMDSDLVGTARYRLGFNQGRAIKTLQYPKSVMLLRPSTDTRTTRSPEESRIFRESLYPHPVRRPLTMNKRKITLIYAITSQ